MAQEQEWRLLAKEASLEKDPKKLIEIVDALNRALEESDHRKLAESQSNEAA